MEQNIRISESTFSRLQHLATPFVDTPATVIDKLLDFFEGQKHDDLPKTENKSQKLMRIIRDVSDRNPRQRGIVVKLNGTTIKAHSLPDLYGQVLKYLCDSGRIDAVSGDLPLATSSKRYLISKNPTHQDGKAFFSQVEYDGYFMEAHKSYVTGISHLKKLVDLCGLALVYVE